MLGKYTLPLFSPKEIKKKVTLSYQDTLFLHKTRLMCRNIIQGKEKKIALFLGPCSIHDEKATSEYALLLQKLQKKADHHYLIVMRLFFEKSRSKFGWRGMLHDPDLDGSYKIQKGIERIRKLCASITQMRVPICAEILDPLALPYYEDFLSWGFIGARTSSSPIHRQIASSLTFPVGFKNSLHGDVEIALSGAQVAQRKSQFIGVNEEGRICRIVSPGNKSVHIVLRGGENKPNFASREVEQALQLQEKENFNQGIVIDCSHGNANKILAKQKAAYRSVVDQIHKGNRWIKGIMLEGFIKAGHQPVDGMENLEYGMSVTDPCLSWEETERLILHSLPRLTPG
jgi:3-deoxy-7-phosphoheptulonate synthase